jgi:hypothetical protein
MANKLKQWRNEKRYAAKLNLLSKITREVLPALEASRRADDILDRCTRVTLGVTSQGYSNMAGSSRLEVHTIGNLRGTESLVAPDSFEACALQGMEQAENNSRNIADNN